MAREPRQQVDNLVRRAGDSRPTMPKSISAMRLPCRYITLPGCGRHEEAVHQIILSTASAPRAASAVRSRPAASMAADRCRGCLRSAPAHSSRCSSKSNTRGGRGCRGRRRSCARTGPVAGLNREVQLAPERAPQLVHQLNGSVAPRLREAPRARSAPASAAPCFAVIDSLARNALASQDDGGLSGRASCCGVKALSRNRLEGRPATAPAKILAGIRRQDRRLL